MFSFIKFFQDKYLISFSNEYVLVINVKSGEVVKKIHNENKHLNISSIELSHKSISDLLAVG